MEVQEIYRGQVQFIGIPSLSDAAEMRAFIEETGVTGFPHIADVDGEIWERFGVVAQRTYVYIDDDGEWRQSGYGSLLEDVKALVAS